MERRNFLRSLGIGAVATMLPFGALSELLKETPTPISSDFTIHYSTKTISYSGSSNDGFTIKELYNFLRDEWNNELGESPLCISPDIYMTS